MEACGGGDGGCRWRSVVVVMGEEAGCRRGCGWGIITLGVRVSGADPCQAARAGRHASY